MAHDSGSVKAVLCGYTFATIGIDAWRRRRDKEGAA